MKTTYNILSFSDIMPMEEKLDKEINSPADETHCPDCDASCFFDALKQPSDDLTPVTLECHRCGHIWQHALITEETPSSQPSPQRQRKEWHGVMVLVLLLTLLGGGAGYYYHPYLMQLLNEVLAPPPPVPPLPLAQAEFTVTKKDFSARTLDDSLVLLVTVNIANSGSAEGRPQGINLTLVDPNGSRLLTWPMSPSLKNIAPGQEMVFTSELIEPPDNIADVNVTIF